VDEGKGTLGKLMNDEQVYDQLSATMANLDAFSERLNSGEGTLGRLVNDAELADKIGDTFDNVNSASETVREIIDANRENIDTTIKNVAEAAPKLNEGLDSFTSIGKKIDDGEGTLGKLVNDPGLYDDVRGAVNQVRRAFEEGEEQSVMRTFLGVFFGSVI
jgi:phospholipid/cholesterol/gamma-HCH transport system substrate-binding protein